uniref:HIT-type domain-containing protein n=1 Tax=Strongyloides venezuelensis TaxID=75913 RepID=A0A0K0FR45_STRVS
METCYFCNCDSTSMNKCPKCKKNFCSLKCYKCQKHYCSEQFYKEWVDLMNGTKKEKPVIMPFEEYMKYEDAKAEKVDMPIDVDENEADNIDSDDDDLSYIDNVIKDATEDFSKLSMADIDAQLTSKGVNILDGDEESSMNELFSKLTCEEQKAFNRLYEEYQLSLSQVSKSCFKK